MTILAQLTADLPGQPRFHRFRHRDVNPLGGYKKERWIHAPNKAMRVIHERLMAVIASQAYALPYASCGAPGNSPLRNVLRHRRSRYFYLTDLRSAYHQVDMFSLAILLCTLIPEFYGLEEETEAFLKRYCHDPHEGGLRTGANSSVMLFNLFAGVMIDSQLPLKEYGLTYSRYLDDLTFSAKKAPIGWRKRRAIRQVIEAAGFPINHRKSHVLDLKKSPIVINGIALERGGRIFLPRHYLRKLRGMIHLARQDRLDEQLVFGRMGVFMAVTHRDLRKMRNIERRLMDDYIGLRTELYHEP